MDAPKRKASEAYLAKLKDPRWQKKRLQILERDEWACQHCFDAESTLHVHHRYYVRGQEPWECEDGALLTLCESCHESETVLMAEELDHLALQLKRHFLAADINILACGFNALRPLHLPEVVASAIEWMLSDEDTQRMVLDAYFAHLEERRRAREEGGT